MKVGKVTIPLLPLAESEVPVVKFYIKGNPYLAIVDTGAESTIIDVTLKDELETKSQEEVALVGISGEKKANTILTGTIKVWMQNEKGHVFITSVKGFLSDITHVSNHFLSQMDCREKIVAVFGADMLNNLNAKVDFVKKEVHFKI